MEVLLLLLQHTVECIIIVLEERRSRVIYRVCYDLFSPYILGNVAIYYFQLQKQ